MILKTTMRTKKALIGESIGNLVSFRRAQECANNRTGRPEPVTAETAEPAEPFGELCALGGLGGEGLLDTQPATHSLWVVATFQP
jgi:hypothetical protein